MKNPNLKKIGMLKGVVYREDAVVYDSNYIARTIKCNGGGNYTIMKLKSKYANELLKTDIRPYSVVRHSYTNNRLQNGEENLKRVQSKENNLSPTLHTRCDCLGVVVKNNEYTDLEKQLFTRGGHIKRYLGSDKVDEFKEGQMATTTFPNGYGHGPRTHNESIALNTIDRPSVKMNLRIRKLVPSECIKLMGFEKKDEQAMREIGMSDAAIYHMAGDSIITTCLMAIFGQMLFDEKELQTKINNYVETIKEN